VFANSYAFRLLALACGLLDKLNRNADLELIERRLHHVVTAEIEFAPVSGLDEAVALFEKQAHYLAVLRHYVRLDDATLDSHDVLEFPGGGIESVAHRHVDVLVMVAIDSQLVPGHADVEANVELLALVMVTIALLDDDAATDNARMKFLELRSFLANTRFHRVGVLKITEGNLQRDLLG